MEQVQHFNLLTRQQIIDLWNEQQQGLKNSYCCPNCRNVLDKSLDNEGNVYYSCINDLCGYVGKKIYNYAKEGK